MRDKDEKFSPQTVTGIMRRAQGETREAEKGQSAKEKGQMSAGKFTRENTANVLFGVVIGIIVQHLLLARVPDWIGELTVTALLVVGLILVQRAKGK